MAEEQPLTAAQSGRITALLKQTGFGKTEGLAFYAATIDRPVKATRELSAAEADQIIAALEDLTDADS